MHHLIKGFTLIELLIVIIIISTLAVALIPRVRSIQEQTRIRAANIYMKDFNNAITMARINNPQTLLAITQNWCSDCACRAESDLRNLPTNHTCRTNWNHALQRIEIAAGLQSGALQHLQQDPRWSPYQLDQNEWETRAHNNECIRDSFFSAGPDGSRSNISDNIYLVTAPTFCPWAY